MPTKNNEKRVFRGTKIHKHKLAKSRGKVKEKGHIPIFLGMGLAVMLLFAMVGVASATDYYVAKGGSDSNPGTEAEPWLTIQKAADTLVAGDTVYVKAGTYYERITLPHSGSSGAYITFRNYGNDIVDINGAGGDGDMITSHGNSYIQILGFRIGNTIGKGIRISGGWGRPIATHIDLRNNIIHDLQRSTQASSAIYFEHTTDFIVDNNEIYNCDPRGNEVIRVTKGCTDFKITNNYLHDNHFIGIDIVSWSQGGTDIPTRGLIKGNIVHHSISPPEYPACNGIYIDGATYIVIEDNICYNNNVGIHIGSEYSEDVANHIITRRNLLYNNDRDLVVGEYGGNVQDTATLHNTIYFQVEATWPLAVQFSPLRGSNIFKNNIIYMHSNPECIVYNLNTDKPDSDYNCFYPNDRAFCWGGTAYNSFSEYQAGTGQDSHSISQDPKFVDIANHDFHLQIDSPCINVGDFLTTTTSSGSGTAIPVEDARYFTDGYGGLFEGDLIQVSSNNPVRVTNVNYESNVIAVDQSISWGNGDGVSYPYSGSAPDIGAYESEYGVATGTISGTVTDKGTGLPIEGVVVSDSTRLDTTDSTGDHTINNVLAGTYTVTASKAGYEDGSQDNVIVTEDATTTVDFVLTPISTGTISGTVTDADTGLAIEGALISDGARSATTNSSGVYIIENAPVGTYPISCSKAGYIPSSQTVTVTESAITTADFQLIEAPDLIGLWHFDEGSGTITEDTSGNNNDGALTNMDPATDWVDGKIGKALNFDGTDDYVDCGNDTSLDITDAITIEAWIKPTVAGEGGSNAAIVTKAESGVDWSWQLRYNAPGGGNYMGFQFNGDPEGSTWVSVKQDLSPGEWYHIAGTFDGTNIKCYLNGIEKGMNQISAIKGGNARLFIGQDGWDNIFNGTIDEVRIYNRALSADEIKADYESGLEDTSPPIVTNPTATPATILLNDNSRPRVPSTNISQLNVMVTDNTEVDTVTIDLSPISGSTGAQMSKIPGTDIWSVTVTATAGINLTHNLIVTATDIYGNSNTSVSIQLTVLRRGDVFRDNIVDMKDAEYIARYLAGSEPEVPNLELVGDIVGENGSIGDGVVDMKDATYIARYEAGFEDVP